LGEKANNTLGGKGGARGLGSDGLRRGRGVVLSKVARCQGDTTAKGGVRAAEEGGGRRRKEKKDSKRPKTASQTPRNFLFVHQKGLHGGGESGQVSGCIREVQEGRKGEKKRSLGPPDTKERKNLIPKKTQGLPNLRLGGPFWGGVPGKKKKKWQGGGRQRAT